MNQAQAEAAGRAIETLTKEITKLYGLLQLQLQVNAELDRRVAELEVQLRVAQKGAQA